jgi:hypothetical protein
MTSAWTCGQRLAGRFVAQGGRLKDTQPMLEGQRLDRTGHEASDRARPACQACEHQSDLVAGGDECRQRFAAKSGVPAKIRRMACSQGGAGRGSGSRRDGADAPIGHRRRMTPQGRRASGRLAVLFEQLGADTVLLQARQVLDEHPALEMVHLVLDAHRQQTIGIERECCAVLVERARTRDTVGALDVRRRSPAPTGSLLRTPCGRRWR